MRMQAHLQPRHRVWRKKWWLAITCATVATATVSCGDKTNSATNFCRQLDKELAGLSSPLTSQSDVDVMVARYRRLGEVAPLSVSKDWQALTSVMQDAAKVDPNDQEAMEKFAAEALVANSASQRALRWVLDTCGVDLSGSRPASQ